MKKIIKISLVLLLIVTVTSCENNNDNSRFSNDPTSGWVEFKTAQTTTGQTATSVTIPLDIRVPVYKNGLNISYTIQAVDGDFTQFVSSSSGTAFADPNLENSVDGSNRSVNLVLDLMNMDASRDFVTVFDVVLTSVSANNVSVGVDENSIVTHRVTIPCSNPAILPSDYFVGDYMIQDVTGTIGPGNGTENFESGIVTISVDPSNPNARTFSTYVVPAFTSSPKVITLEFTADNVIALGDVATGIGCSATQYIYTEAGANNSPWDVCNDQSVIVNYTEDTNSSCGGPFNASFSLVKQN
jgi:hypothetical protein